MTETTAPRSRRRTRRALAALLPTLLLAGLAACAADPDGPPRTPDGAPSRDDWALAYAECMRDHGVDLPDPGKGLTFGTSDEQQDADAACVEQLGPPPGEAPQPSDEELMAGWIELAECLREQGVDVADPTDEGLRVPTDAPDSALEACHDPLGSGGGAGRTPQLSLP